MPTNRRRFLKTGGLAALLGVTGLSGCLDGGSGSLGLGNQQPTQQQRQGSWQYDPNALVESENRFFGTMDYAQIYENRQYLPESSRGNFETDGDSPVDASEIGQLTGVGGGRYTPATRSGAVFGSLALTGEFDRDTLTTAIEDGDAERTGEYQGYLLFENADPVDAGPGTDSAAEASATIGVGDGALVMGVVSDKEAGVDATGADAVRTMIDASLGQAPTLEANSEYARQLSDQVSGESMRFGGEVDPELVGLMQAETSMESRQFFAGIRAVGVGMTVDGETTTFTFTGIYDNATTAEETGIVGLVEATSDRATRESEGVDSITASRNGAAVSVEMSGGTRELFRDEVPAAPGGSGPGTVLSL
jgi:hypothetical protein